MKLFSVSIATFGCLAAAMPLALSIGCAKHGEPLPPETTASDNSSGAVRVTAKPVEFRPVQRIVGLVGTLHGYEEISLGAKVGGRVRKIAHDVSDRVKPGEILLELDPTDFQLNVRQAQRNLQVELAKLGLTDAPTGKFDVTNIPTVVQASLRRENAQIRLERAKGLVAKRAIAEEDLIERTSEFRVAQAEYDNQVLIAKAGIAAIAVKNEALSIARQQLVDCVIRAPEPTQALPGDIKQDVVFALTSRPVSEGSYVMPGTELFKLVIDRPLKFRGRVPERKIGEVRLGQTAHVFSAAYEKPFPGQVTRINPAVDPQTRAFEVEVLVPNLEGELKPGGFAKTGILTEVSESTATVPLEALVSFAGVTKIFLIEGGKAKEVQVALGVQGTDWVEIASPALPQGASVVTSGHRAIADGTSVALRESETPRAAGLASVAEPAAVESPEASPPGNSQESQTPAAQEAAPGPMARREK